MTSPATASTPPHIEITDRPVRDYHAICLQCRARVDVGVYPDDPERANRVMDEWILRHLHEDTP